MIPGVVGGEWDHGGVYAVATFLVVAVLTLAFTQLAPGALIATPLLGSAKRIYFEVRGRPDEDPGQ